MKDITVIVPCYNAQGTILRTLQSLEEQTYKKFKVILIDDGSIDETAKVIQEYCQYSSMDIEVIFQENAGVSCARNVGIHLAETPYITFLDADDEYYDDTLEIFHDMIIKKNVDLGCASYVLINGQHKAKKKSRKCQISIKSKYEMFEIYVHHKKYHLNFCCAIYKKEILERSKLIFSNDIKYGEDSMFFLQYLKNCTQNVIFMQTPLYCYYNVANSATHKITYDRIQNVYACQISSDYWENDKKCLDEWRYYLIDRALWAVAKDFACFDNYSFFLRLQKEQHLDRAMRHMMKNGDDILIRLTSWLYLISSKLFFMGFAFINKMR